MRFLPSVEMTARFENFATLRLCEEIPTKQNL